jgi:hypothetical protein
MIGLPEPHVSVTWYQQVGLGESEATGWSEVLAHVCRVHCRDELARATHKRCYHVLPPAHRKACERRPTLLTYEGRSPCKGPENEVTRARAR